LTEQVNPIGLQGIQLALPDSIVPFKPFAAQRAFPSFIFRHPGYLAAEEEVTGQCFGPSRFFALPIERKSN
jgi:hypothetical protein